MIRICRTFVVRMLGIALLSSIQALVRAHDIPDEILIQAYLKPTTAQLQAVAMPLLAVTDTTCRTAPDIWRCRLGSCAQDAASQIASGWCFWRTTSGWRSSR
jgi:hypothetical protein